jgi:hypothetical protein
MMDAMHNEMQIPNIFVIGQMSFAMEDKAMDQIFSKTEREDPQYKEWQHFEQIIPLPIDLYEIIDNNYAGYHKDAEPFIMGEHLEEVSFKHTRGINEKPTWRIYYFHVFLMVHTPNLREEGLVWVYQPLYFLLKGADHHGIGHHQGKGLMGIQDLSDVFGAVIENQSHTTWVMFGEGSGIQDIAIEHHEKCIVLLCVLFHFLFRFEFDIFLHCCFCKVNIIFMMGFLDLKK